MLGTGPTRSGAVVGANRERVVRGRRTIISEESLAVAERVGAGVDENESGGFEITGFAGWLQRGECGARAILGSEASRGIEVAVNRQVRLRPQRRHRLRIVGRQ